MAGKDGVAAGAGSWLVTLHLHRRREEERGGQGKEGEERGEGRRGESRGGEGRGRGDGLLH